MNNEWRNSKEAFNYILSIINPKNNIEKDEIDFAAEAVNIAIEIADRFRWHELEDDENDLPEDSKVVEVVIQHKYTKKEQFAHAAYINKEWHINYFSNDYYKVIAWRYMSM